MTFRLWMLVRCTTSKTNTLDELQGMEILNMGFGGPTVSTVPYRTLPAYAYGWDPSATLTHCPDQWIDALLLTHSLNEVSQLWF